MACGDSGHDGRDVPALAAPPTCMQAATGGCHSGRLSSDGTAAARSSNGQEERDVLVLAADLTCTQMWPEGCNGVLRHR